MDNVTQLFFESLFEMFVEKNNVYLNYQTWLHLYGLIYTEIITSDIMTTNYVRYYAYFDKLKQN